MVDEADIYLGIFANRYGYVPKENNPQQISITEMEYNRAVERKIPRLIFLIDKAHPLTIDDVEQGKGSTRLKAFKGRVQTENIVNFFKSPEDLRAHVINGLSQHRKPDLATFDYISNIPASPDPFIAHPYTLLQTHRLVGRQTELNLLTDWVSNPDSAIHQSRILNVVAIGGLGKSALTWKWFKDIAQQVMKPLKGRMWWSFYESDATFENFVTRALAYVTGRPLGEVQEIPSPERETQLLATLDREPFLIVLDGLERILLAYARMDAAHLGEDGYDIKTANHEVKAHGLRESATQLFTGEHRLRKTIDPRAGAFLRKLSSVRAARILVSTRLYPADLEIGTGKPLPGCGAIFLEGLADNDAFELWQTFGVTGERDSLLPFFNLIGNHPLLIQALASEVARYRRAPGDFERWWRDHPDFNQFALPLADMQSHVLGFALSGLDDKARNVMHTIAAFRMPARYDTLAALLNGEGKPCANEKELDEVLTGLEDRGLVGWDKRANRYDLHPLVRSVVWSNLSEDTRRNVYTSLNAHFESLPMVDDYLKVDRLEDLRPAIELYNTLIGLRYYNIAYMIFRDFLTDATLYRLSANRLRVELLEMLFPDGLDKLPPLSSPGRQASVLNWLALGYTLSGQPGRGGSVYRRAAIIDSEMKNDAGLSVVLCNLSSALQDSGVLFEAETAARKALIIARREGNRFQEAISLKWLGLTLAIRGLMEDSESAQQRALRIHIARGFMQSQCVANLDLAQIELWHGDFARAWSFANRAGELVHIQNNEVDHICTARRQGEAALGLNDLTTSDERLHHALSRARRVNLVEEELPTLVALAELRRRQGDLKAGRELLADVWDAAERGPYSLFHADAYNVLTRIERDAGNEAAAVEAATRAYRLAWCDGPPFAYHRGLERAGKHIRELGAMEAEMPPFDKSKYEPMPEVEIDPEDEFHAAKNADD
jgi:tetratricopeptide (TPR) repeat protein